MVGKVTAKLRDPHPEPTSCLAVKLNMAIFLQEHKLEEKVMMECYWKILM